jgi:hypothetical protein
MRSRVLLIALLPLLSLAFAPAPPERPFPVARYQKLAKEAVWLAPGNGELKRCLARHKGAYEVDGLYDPSHWSTIVHVSDADGKKVYFWTGHRGTAFLIRGNVLYYADFGSHSSGCSVVAFDLKARKRLWRSELKGLGPIDHSKYFNAVRMEPVDAQVLAVYGKESAGRYVEFVALKTGKTVGHKKFPER